MTVPDHALARAVPRPRRAWSPEGGVEAAEMLRLLALRPWLVAERDDDAMAKVRQNLPEIRSALGRLGWALVVERDLIRLRKSPPVRRAAWAALAPSPLACTWFFLLVAAAEAMSPAVALGKLVAAAKTAAAEAGVTVTGDITERRAIVQALKLLDDRGVVEQVDGDAQSFLHDDEPPVLLAVHHTRLLHVIANFGAADVAANPLGWLRQVEAESSVAARIGSSAASPDVRGKRTVWIPSSTGWVTLDPRAQRLAADVLLLLNLAERGEGLTDRVRRLGRIDRNDLPPCLYWHRSALDPTRTVGMAQVSQPGTNCVAGCPFELCPYPPKGELSNRVELSEAFARRQQALIRGGPIWRRAAPWQLIRSRDLKRFWKQMGSRAVEYRAGQF